LAHGSLVFQTEKWRKMILSSRVVDNIPKNESVSYICRSWQSSSEENRKTEVFVKINKDF
jgi:hypothetical protein